MENKTDPCCEDSQEFGPNDHSEWCPKRITVCVSVGGVVQFFDLTYDEIAEVWNDAQAACLPETRMGWFDNGWRQLSTGAKIREATRRNPKYKEFITGII